MSELTQEYLDKSLKNLPTKQDVQTIVEDAVDGLAMIVNKGFEQVDKQLIEIKKELDVSEQIKIFEQKFKKLEEALHIKL